MTLIYTSPCPAPDRVQASLDSERIVLFAYFCSLIPLQRKGYVRLQSGLNFVQWQKLGCINCEVLVYILKLIAGGYLSISSSESWFCYLLNSCS